MTWSVCIFAHNEERLLPRCLGALEGAAAGEEYVVHILENGSTDETMRVARAFAAADPRAHVHQLAVADKANAWNEYVHRIAGDADMHIFIDGDIQPSQGAFKSLRFAFEGTPEAYGAAALPASGRSRRAWARRLILRRYLSGNLYALSGRALTMLREREIRMPHGAVGEDGILSYILLTDLKGGRDDSHRERIAIAAGAFFEYESLGLNARDLATLWTRMRRYSKRHFQVQVLYPLLKARGLSAMPDSIDEIYTGKAVEGLRPRLDPRHLYVDVKTIAGIKRRRRILA